MATEGGESPAVEAGAPGTPDPADADVVITTVVSADEPRPAAAPTTDAAGDDLEWVWEDDADDDHLRPPRQAAAPEAEAPADEP
ncbi:MAG TPA: hypothetical protein VFK43_16580, partial [Acidimicrobiales bacterium]|nr:hypothetical protein [Acidimicrobiales bacterium]